MSLYYYTLRELAVANGRPGQEDAGGFGRLIVGGQQGRAGKAAFRLGIGLGVRG